MAKRLDPSLARAVGMTESELKRSESAAKTFNSLVGKMQANMPREATEASNAVSSAMSRMESHSNQVSRRLGGHFKHIGEEAKKSAEKIVHSLAGAFDSIAEHAMHLSGIGGILGGIGGALTGEEFIRGAFDGLTNFTKSMGEAIGATVGKFQSSGIIAKLQEIGNTIAKIFGADFSKFFETTYAPGIGKIEQMTKAGREWVDAISGKWINAIKAGLDAIQATVSFIQQHFELIKNSLLIAFGAMGLGKAYEMGKGVWDFFKNITTMTVNAASVIVNGPGAVGGAAAAEGVAGAAGRGAVGTSSFARDLIFGGNNSGFVFCQKVFKEFLVRVRVLRRTKVRILDRRFDIRPRGIPGFHPFVEIFVRGRDRHNVTIPGCWNDRLSHFAPAESFCG
jgi:hypothetical protein